MKIVITESQYKHLIKSLDEAIVKKSELVKDDLADFYMTLKRAAEKGGLSQQPKKSMVYQKEVESLQIALSIIASKEGKPNPLPVHGVDGLFGPETARAVNKFANESSEKKEATSEIIYTVIQRLKSENTTLEDLKPYLRKTGMIGSSGKIQKEKEIMNFFVNKGLTIEQAAGIVGNLYAESGLRTNAQGDTGTSYGIAQWHDTRKIKLFNWAESKGKDVNNLSTQLEFLWYELNTTESKALSFLKTATDASEAAEIFARYYERPKSKNYQKRVSFANNVMSNYTSIS